MRRAVIAAGWLLAMAGTALAQQGQGQAQGQGSGGPQPGKQQATGLFPPNEPAPRYSTSSNNADASLQAPGGTSSPNAGNTGLTGSGSQSYGWSGPAYGPQAGRK
ncbi:MAG TPA: hypothetical protein VJ779_22035 [Acetobacteraceae bacterium]|nr:hypothetical protein [Acetobacteraceae bacterium]